MQAIDDGFNQYCRTFGQPILVENISKFYGEKLNRKIDPLKEVLVGCGANGVLNSCMLGLVNQGDEIIIFEPLFPWYLDHVRMVGAVLKLVPLENDQDSGDWNFNSANLKSVLNEKTKILLLNSPHNPTGKCFSF